MAFSKNDEEIQEVLNAHGIKCNQSASTVAKYKKIARNDGANDHAIILTKLKELSPPEPTKLSGIPVSYAHETTQTPSESNFTSVQEQENTTLAVKPVELPTQVTTENGSEVNRVKTERVIYFPDVKNRANRKFLSLEKPFVDALAVLAPDKEKRNEWLNTVLVDDPKHAAAIVRNTIVTELLKQVQP